MCDRQADLTRSQQTTEVLCVTSEKNEGVKYYVTESWDMAGHILFIPHSVIIPVLDNLQTG